MTTTVPIKGGTEIRGPATLILDNNCLKYLEDPAKQASFLGSLQAADLQIWPTAINVLEAVRNPNESVRTRCLRILKALAQGRPVLPTLDRLLRQAGEAMVTQAGGFYAEVTGLEMWLTDPSSLTEEQRRGAEDFLNELQANFNAMHDRARPAFQKYLNGDDPWGNAATFLDHQWTKAEQQDVMIQRLWTRLGLPGDAPVEQLLKNETWRLVIDAQGVAVYERVMARKQPVRVDQPDLMQLVYLGGSRRRIFLTEDNAAHRAASAVLVGRYKGARAFTWREFESLDPFQLSAVDDGHP